MAARCARVPIYYGHALVVVDENIGGPDVLQCGQGQR